MPRTKSLRKRQLPVADTHFQALQADSSAIGHSLRHSCPSNAGISLILRLLLACPELGQDAVLQATPIVGPTIETAGEDISQGNIAGGAGGLTGVAAQILAPKLIEGSGKLTGKTADLVKRNFLEPPKPPAAPERPSPVSQALPVDTAFSDSVIRKLGGKDLSPNAREVLRNSSGPTVQAGSSPELHLLKSVAPINETIATQGAALDKILQAAPPLSVAPEAAVTKALDGLRESLPGGTESTLGKAIDKVQARYADALKSTSPTEINQTIRDLDERISDYSAPESQLEGPASVQDAALVLVRRSLRNILNSEIPASTPLNKTLAENLEVRGYLRKKLGQIASDPAAANQEYQTQLKLGQDQLAAQQNKSFLDEEYERRRSAVGRNKGIAKTVAAVGAGAGLATVAKQVIKNLVP